jgi:hypothetical protein
MFVVWGAGCSSLVGQSCGCLLLFGDGVVGAHCRLWSMLVDGGGSLSVLHWVVIVVCAHLWVAVGGHSLWVSFWVFVVTPLCLWALAVVCEQ